MRKREREREEREREGREGWIEIEGGKQRER